jgi:hypothetical protein
VNLTWIGIIAIGLLTAIATVLAKIADKLDRITRQIGALGDLLGSIDSRAADMQERLEMPANPKPHSPD